MSFRNRTVCAALAVLLAAPLPAWASWWNNDWSYRKEVILDGTAQGAALKGDVAQMPVLVRLHDGVFRFADASPDGADLRFVAGDDKTPLKYYIEKYDSAFNLAFVWVAVPTLSAAQPVKLWLYYGNPKAANEGDARAIYDSSQVLTYHFADRTAPGADSTGYANNATAAPKLDDEGLIGSAARLDGASPLSLPGAGTLALTAGMTRTVMLWLKPAAAAQTAVVLQQADATSGVTVGLNAGIPYVTLAGAGAPPQTATAAAALVDGWHHLAIASSATQTTLYVDGIAGAPITGPLPAVAATAVIGAAGYTGLLDEFTVANAERTPDYIHVVAMNQGVADRIIRFGADEALSSWQSGYFAIILKSVTLDGWVVIGILMIMSVISIVVMIRKTRQINRVTRSNAAFLDLFKRSRGDFMGLRNLLTTDTAGRDPEVDRLRGLARQSPLCHVFAAGVDELRERLRDESASAGSGRLTSESIEAIRATLDASIVTENESLSSQMVLLTIAISGGPFLGLLGTVVGVMITFAAIAAAGDVNINAIAPGIAAALVATVAGLVVAIPALFGYNYLTTRINSASARMQVFLDAFITRMAENSNHPRELRAMSAGG